MDYILKDLQPQNVFRYFEEVSRIPRGSGNEQAVSDYLVKFATDHSFAVKRDAALNVVFDKPASPGYENRPKIILQGHMDMVAVKDAGSDHDFLKDPIELVIDGEYLRANGTSLGADDGNALALILAIFDDDTIEHPALQALITTQEELGLCGAMALDASMMDGDYLINLDYSQDTNLLVSCAGSSHSYFRVPHTTEASDEGASAFEIRVDSLTGGHSGNTIFRGLANANRIMGELISGLRQAADVRLSFLEGGTKSNTIPDTARAILVAAPEQSKRIFSVFESLSSNLKWEYQLTDPNVSFTIQSCDRPQTVFSEDTTEKLLSIIDLIPNGAQSYLDEVHTQTKCSANLGVIREQEQKTILVSMLRSNSEYEHDQLIRRMRRLARLVGVEFENTGRNAVWEHRSDSKLTEQVQLIWEQVRGYRPPLNIIHAGVEPGTLIGKMAERGKKIEAIGVGIHNIDVHTTKERVEIASLQRGYELLLEILRKLQ